jgi:hypothetical protein
MTKDEVLDLALDALCDFDYDKRQLAITAIKQARSAPVQEPHSWYSAEHDEWMTNKTRKEHEALNSYTHKVGGFDLALYTNPPAAQRPWVGLTDEEIDSIYEQHHNQYAECISVNFGYERAIEAKLKELNK